MLSQLVITFLPRSKHLLISWLQPSSAVILESRKIKSTTVSTVSPSICHEVTGLDAMILVFWTLNFRPTFSLSSFTFIKRLFSSSLSAIRVVSSACLRLLIFLQAIADFLLWIQRGQQRDFLKEGSQPVRNTFVLTICCYSLCVSSSVLRNWIPASRIS